MNTKYKKSERWREKYLKRRKKMIKFTWSESQITILTHLLTITETFQITYGYKYDQITGSQGDIK